MDIEILVKNKLNIDVIHSSANEIENPAGWAEFDFFYVCIRNCFFFV